MFTIVQQLSHICLFVYNHSCSWSISKFSFLGNAELNVRISRLLWLALLTSLEVISVCELAGSKCVNILSLLILVKLASRNGVRYLYCSMAFGSYLPIFLDISWPMYSKVSMDCPVLLVAQLASPDLERTPPLAVSHWWLFPLWPQLSH